MKPTACAIFTTESDLSDGGVLCGIIEELTDEKIEAYQRRPKSFEQKKANFSIILKHLVECANSFQSFDLPNLLTAEETPRLLAEGNNGVFWKVFSNLYDIAHPNIDSPSPKRIFQQKKLVENIEPITPLHDLSRSFHSEPTPLRNSVIKPSPFLDVTPDSDDPTLHLDFYNLSHEQNSIISKTSRHSSKKKSTKSLRYQDDEEDLTKSGKKAKKAATRQNLDDDVSATSATPKRIEHQSEQFPDDFPDEQILTLSQKSAKSLNVAATPTTTASFVTPPSTLSRVEWLETPTIRNTTKQMTAKFHHHLKIVEEDEEMKKGRELHLSELSTPLPSSIASASALSIQQASFDSTYASNYLAMELPQFDFSAGKSKRKKQKTSLESKGIDEIEKNESTENEKNDQEVLKTKRSSKYRESRRYEETRNERGRDNDKRYNKMRLSEERERLRSLERQTAREWREKKEKEQEALGKSRKPTTAEDEMTLYSLELNWNPSTAGPFLSKHSESRWPLTERERKEGKGKEGRNEKSGWNSEEGYENDERSGRKKSLSPSLVPATSLQYHNEMLRRREAGAEKEKKNEKRVTHGDVMKKIHNGLMTEWHERLTTIVDPIAEKIFKEREQEKARREQQMEEMENNTKLKRESEGQKGKGNAESNVSGSSDGESQSKRRMMDAAYKDKLEKEALLEKQAQLEREARATAEQQSRLEAESKAKLQKKTKEEEMEDKMGSHFSKRQKRILRWLYENGIDIFYYKYRNKKRRSEKENLLNDNMSDGIHDMMEKDSNREENSDENKEEDNEESDANELSQTDLDSEERSDKSKPQNESCALPLNYFSTLTTPPPSSLRKPCCVDPLFLLAILPDGCTIPYLVSLCLSSPVMGLQKLPKSSAARRSNIERSLNALKNVKKMKRRHLMDADEIMRGEKMWEEIRERRRKEYKENKQKDNEKTEDVLESLTDEERPKQQEEKKDKEIMFSPEEAEVNQICWELLEDITEAFNYPVKKLKDGIPCLPPPSRVIGKSASKRSIGTAAPNTKAKQEASSTATKNAVPSVSESFSAIQTPAHSKQQALPEAQNFSKYSVPSPSSAPLQTKQKTHVVRFSAVSDPLPSTKSKNVRSSSISKSASPSPSSPSSPKTYRSQSPTERISASSNTSRPQSLSPSPNFSASSSPYSSPYSSPSNRSRSLSPPISSMSPRMQSRQRRHTSPNSSSAPFSRTSRSPLPLHLLSHVVENPPQISLEDEHDAERWLQDEVGLLTPSSENRAMMSALDDPLCNGVMLSDLATICRQAASIAEDWSWNSTSGVSWSQKDEGSDGVKRKQQLFVDPFSVKRASVAKTSSSLASPQKTDRPRTAVEKPGPLNLNSSLRSRSQSPPVSPYKSRLNSTATQNELSNTKQEQGGSPRTSKKVRQTPFTCLPHFPCNRCPRTHNDVRQNLQPVFEWLQRTERVPPVYLWNPDEYIKGNRDYIYGIILAIQKKFSSVISELYESYGKPDVIRYPVAVQMMGGENLSSGILGKGKSSMGIGRTSISSSMMSSSVCDMGASLSGGIGGGLSELVRFGLAGRDAGMGGRYDGTLHKTAVVVGPNEGSQQSFQSLSSLLKLRASSTIPGVPLPYTASQLTDLEESLVDWINGLHLISGPPFNTFDSMLPSICSGTLLCSICSLLGNSRLVGVIPDPKTTLVKKRNVEKALSILRGIKNFPRTHVHSHAANVIVQGERQTIVGLLEDIHRAQDGMEPAPRHKMDVLLEKAKRESESQMNGSDGDFESISESKFLNLQNTRNVSSSLRNSSESSNASVSSLLSFEPYLGRRFKSTARLQAIHQNQQKSFSSSSSTSYFATAIASATQNSPFVGGGKSGLTLSQSYASPSTVLNSTSVSASLSPSMSPSGSLGGYSTIGFSGKQLPFPQIYTSAPTKAQKRSGLHSIFDKSVSNTSEQETTIGPGMPNRKGKKTKPGFLGPDVFTCCPRPGGDEEGSRLFRSRADGSLFGDDDDSWRSSMWDRFSMLSIKSQQQNQNETRASPTGREGETIPSPNYSSNVAKSPSARASSEPKTPSSVRSRHSFRSPRPLSSPLSSSKYTSPMSPRTHATPRTPFSPLTPCSAAFRQQQGRDGQRSVFDRGESVMLTVSRLAHNALTLLRSKKQLIKMANDVEVGVVVDMRNMFVPPIPQAAVQKEMLMEERKVDGENSEDKLTHVAVEMSKSIKNTQTIAETFAPSAGYLLAKWLDSVGIHLASPFSLESPVIHEFSDGLLLADLVSKLEHRDIPGVSRKPKSKAEYLHNISATLKVLLQKGTMPLDFLGAEAKIMKGEADVIIRLLECIRKIYSPRALKIQKKR
eukprot:MONOS_11069.1-p1 / transcript=MONOS_11069.1 / gene=MONOS_11069 / organism=Monocercomonoides_exilis_PA203 / gene_product=unspecified product / transcript_product=unspecified product / location=Mono_scaffold00534:26556-34029(-) / protein_length=2327 / sequence_SO=supercontig / SO=protein_coding / is_pseudo=false